MRSDALAHTRVQTVRYTAPMNTQVIGNTYPLGSSRDLVRFRTWYATSCALDISRMRNLSSRGRQAKHARGGAVDGSARAVVLMMSVDAL